MDTQKIQEYFVSAPVDKIRCRKNIYDHLKEHFQYTNSFSFEDSPTIFLLSHENGSDRIGDILSPDRIDRLINEYIYICEHFSSGYFKYIPIKIRNLIKTVLFRNILDKKEKETRESIQFLGEENIKTISTLILEFERKNKCILPITVSKYDVDVDIGEILTRGPIVVKYKEEKFEDHDSIESWLNFNPHIKYNPNLSFSIVQKKEVGKETKRRRFPYRVNILQYKKIIGTITFPRIANFKICTKIPKYLRRKFRILFPQFSFDVSNFDDDDDDFTIINTFYPDASLLESKNPVDKAQKLMASFPNLKEEEYNKLRSLECSRFYQLHDWNKTIKLQFYPLFISSLLKSILPEITPDHLEQFPRDSVIRTINTLKTEDPLTEDNVKIKDTLTKRESLETEGESLETEDNVKTEETHEEQDILKIEESFKTEESNLSNIDIINILIHTRNLVLNSHDLFSLEYENKSFLTSLSGINSIRRWISSVFWGSDYNSNSDISFQSDEKILSPITEPSLISSNQIFREYSDLLSTINTAENANFQNRFGIELIVAFSMILKCIPEEYISKYLDRFPIHNIHETSNPADIINILINSAYQLFYIDKPLTMNDIYERHSVFVFSGQYLVYLEHENKRMICHPLIFGYNMYIFLASIFMLELDGKYKHFLNKKDEIIPFKGYMG